MRFISYARSSTSESHITNSFIWTANSSSHWGLGQQDEQQPSFLTSIRSSYVLQVVSKTKTCNIMKFAQITIISSCSQRNLLYSNALLGGIFRKQKLIAREILSCLSALTSVQKLGPLYVCYNTVLQPLLTSQSHGTNYWLILEVLSM